MSDIHSITPTEIGIDIHIWCKVPGITKKKIGYFQIRVATYQEDLSNSILFLYVLVPHNGYEVNETDVTQNILPLMVGVVEIQVFIFSRRAER